MSLLIPASKIAIIFKQKTNKIRREAKMVERYLNTLNTSTNKELL